MAFLFVAPIRGLFQESTVPTSPHSTVEDPPAGSQYLMRVTTRPPTVFVRGDGAYLWDSAGRRHLDWVQGWAVNCLGHAAPPVVQALATQAATLINPSPAYFNPPVLELATRLVRASSMDQVYFCNSGAEANEGAIKLARKWGQLHKGGAHEIITFADGYHGRTLATMSASGKPGWDRMFAPQVEGFPKARLNDLASVRALITPRTVGVMLEPVQGEAGVRPATREFLQALRALCDEAGLLLILDEVQTGYGRTGTLFGYEQAGILPDILTLGKGIGGGVPLAAQLARAHCACFEPGEQGGTYGGNPLMCAVGLAVLDAVTAPGFLAQVRATGEALSNGLRALSDDLGLGEVRGRGLLWALELGGDSGAEVVRRAQSAGLLLNAPRSHCLRFMPALNTTSEQVDEGLAILRQVLAEVATATT